LRCTGQWLPALIHFFFDVATHAGKLLKLHGQANRSQVKRRMTETWGDRSTLERTIQHVLRSMVQWGLLRKGDEPRSLIGPPERVRISGDLGQLLLHSVVLGHGAVSPIPNSSIIRHCSHSKWTYPNAISCGIQFFTFNGRAISQTLSSWRRARQCGSLGDYPGQTGAQDCLTIVWLSALPRTMGGRRATQLLPNLVASAGNGRGLGQA
jgi:hypothetical protein